MAKLPVISGREAVRAFEKDGWRVVRRAKSRHIIMKKEGVVTTLSIPEHKILDRGLPRSLVRDAYIPIEKFNELLKKR
jgi:predicted RNA binding protein YcfA (HicA-like mRNA interferase family)